MSEQPSNPPTPTQKKATTKDLLAEYGMVFVCISFGIFLLEMLVLIALISVMGWEPQEIARTLGLEWLAQQFGMTLTIPETAGTVVMAYILTRPMKFIQIPLAAALTPPVAKVWRRRNAQPESDSPQ